MKVLLLQSLLGQLPEEPLLAIHWSTQSQTRHYGSHRSSPWPPLPFYRRIWPFKNPRRAGSWLSPTVLWDLVILFPFPHAPFQVPKSTSHDCFSTWKDGGGEISSSSCTLSGCVHTCVCVHACVLVGAGISHKASTTFTWLCLLQQATVPKCLGFI